MSKKRSSAPSSAVPGTTGLRNIGPTSARWLEAVGVHGRDDLERLGVVETFLRVRDAGFGASLNLLWALQGAVMDLHWAEVPAEIKERLRRQLGSG